MFMMTMKMVKDKNKDKEENLEDLHESNCFRPTGACPTWQQTSSRGC